jgi:hypothetical protein
MFPRLFRISIRPKPSLHVRDLRFDGNKSFIVAGTRLNIKRHLPVGVLYDMHQRVNSLDPWRIKLETDAPFPTDKILPLSALGSVNTVRDHFMSSVKEVSHINL